MVKLVCKENPSIFIVAPDELVSEVGGNCWQVGGPQPITYPKHLWEKMDYVLLPSNLDEEANDRWALYEYRESPKGLYSTCYIDGFKTGAEWMAGQGETFNGYISMKGKRSLIAIEGKSDYKFGDRVVVQIRNK